MTKTPPAEDPQRRNGKAIAEQPYSVDPKKPPMAGHAAAGPKRRHKQAGQALHEAPDNSEDDK